MNNKTTISKKSDKQPKSPNYITQDEENQTEYHTHNITQDDDNLPENNTWSKSHNPITLTQEVLLACRNTKKKQATPRKLALRKFPL